MKRTLFLPTLFLAFAGPVTAQSATAALSADDASAIRAALNEWCAGALAGDLDRSMSAFSSHAVEVFQDGQSTISKANIAARYRGWFEGGTWAACENDIKSLEGDGATAFLVASNTQSWINTRSGSETDYAFTFWMLMKREADGKWRVLVHHWGDAS